jgi:hypothetical protein
VSVFAVSVPPHGDNSTAGHWAFWEAGTECGDVNVGNLMYDPLTKRGVLGDLDLARKSPPSKKPSAKDNTQAVPFLALDLLTEEPFRNLVLHLHLRLHGQR